MKIKSVLFLGVSLIAIMVSILEPAGVFAYDNNTIHRVINEKAGKNSLILDDYIITCLGYPEGINKTFKGSRVWELLSEGGFEEDKPKTRSLDHFLDPLQPWDDAGLWDSKLLVFRNASVEWAQRSDNDYSWAQARNHFYKALTTGSETEFANTFRTIGQLMHLVSDMGVPAHVRDDAHLSGDPYETWTADSKNFNILDFTGIKVDPAIFNQALTTSEAPAPITALWDLDQYNGTNPGITLPSRPLPPTRVFPPPPAVMKVGLAEYTNANFFSKDTIFKGYAHPSYWNTTPIGDGDWLNPETVLGEDGKPDNLVYAWGYAGGTGNIRLAGASFITRDSANAGYVSPPMVIDDNVNKDYASRLIPAAVGYSTALLDYFFRGDINLTSEPSESGYFIVNNSDEDLAGTFALYYDDTSGNRRKLPGAEWVNTTITANGRIPAGRIAIPDDHAVPPQYFLVFNGQMGREGGAVAGRVVSLKPFGLLAIKISGNLNDTKGNPSGSVGPAVFLVWDVNHNAPLVLPKTGNGHWAYPLSANDYYGDYLDDLRLFFGTEIETTETNRLFEITKVSSNILEGGSEWPRGGDSNSIYWPRTGYLGEFDVKYYPADIPCDEFFRNHVCAPYEYSTPGQTITATGQTAENNCGGVDTWSQTLFKNKHRQWDNLVRIFDGPFDGPVMAVWNSTDSGDYGSENESSYNMNFHLPYGGSINPGLFIGWSAPKTNPYGLKGEGFYVVDITRLKEKTAVPRPFLAESFALTRLNNSGTPVKFLGPEIYYEASQIASWGRNTTLTDGLALTTGNAQYDVTTNGTFTTLSGTVLGVGLSFSEVASTGSYFGQRSTRYVTDSLSVASSIDPDSNIMTMIAVQSIASGKAATALTPPLNPAVYGTQGPVKYSDQTNSYHIRTICAAVEDTNTQNPWEIPDNTALTTELHKTITLYTGDNPPGTGYHWKISTEIYKID